MSFDDTSAMWEEFGRKYGYNKCCIESFVEEARLYIEYGINLQAKRDGRKLVGTGFIPCQHCSDTKTEVQLVEEIMDKRDKSLPLFPYSERGWYYHFQKPDEVQEEITDLIKRLIQQSPKYKTGVFKMSVNNENNNARYKRRVDPVHFKEAVLKLKAMTFEERLKWREDFNNGCDEHSYVKLTQMDQEWLKNKIESNYEVNVKFVRNPEFIPRIPANVYIYTGLDISQNVLRDLKRMICILYPDQYFTTLFQIQENLMFITPILVDRQGINRKVSNKRKAVIEEVGGMYLLTEGGWSKDYNQNFGRNSKITQPFYQSLSDQYLEELGYTPNFVFDTISEYEARQKESQEEVNDE